MHALSARGEGCSRTSLRALLAHAIKDVAYQTITLATGAVIRRLLRNRLRSLTVLIGGTVFTHMAKTHTNSALVGKEICLEAFVLAITLASVVKTWQKQEHEPRATHTGTCNNQHTPLAIPILPSALVRLGWVWPLLLLASVVAGPRVLTRLGLSWGLANTLLLACAFRLHLLPLWD